MVAIALPPVDDALANQVIVILTTPPAAPSGIPTVAEVNAGIFAQCYLYARFNAAPNQSTGEGPRKLCSRSAETSLGQVTYEAIELQSSYKPQELGTPGHVGNKLYEAVEPGVEVTAVVLDALPGDTTSAVVAGAVSDIFKVKAGVRAKGTTGDGEFDKLAFTSKLIVVGGRPIAEDHALAAT